MGDTERLFVVILENSSYLCGDKNNNTMKTNKLDGLHFYVMNGNEDDGDFTELHFYIDDNCIKDDCERTLLDNIDELVEEIEDEDYEGLTATLLCELSENEYTDRTVSELAHFGEPQNVVIKDKEDNVIVEFEIDVRDFL